MNRLILTASILIAPAAAMAGHVGGNEPFNHSVIWNFANGADGNEPRGELMVGKDGMLYGTSGIGGANNSGTVYSLLPPAQGMKEGTLTPLWVFTGGDDGSFPTGAVVGDPAHGLYLTAEFDGKYGHGTVLRLMPPPGGSGNWIEKTLWSFTGGADGGNPFSTLLRGTDGSLFGTTNFGGAANHGVVFKLSPPAMGDKWVETVLWRFTGGADGALPVTGLIADADGALYGTTKAGGTAGAGVVFRLTPPADGQGAWREDILWNFSGGADGAAPVGALVADSTGALYGTTNFGGRTKDCPQPIFPYYGNPESQTAAADRAPYIPVGGNGCGVVFKLAAPQNGKAPWVQTVLWRFKGANGIDGGNPVGPLLLANGVIYGSSSDYSDEYYGSLFKLTPPADGTGDWKEAVITAFYGHYFGFYPHTGVVLGNDGLLYGTTMVGGLSWTHVTIYGYGCVFNAVP